MASRKQPALPLVYDDGGRKAAGFTGRASDCVTRAVAIATGKPYREVYDAFAEHCDPDEGVRPSVSDPLLREWGWKGWWWKHHPFDGEMYQVGTHDLPVDQFPRMIVTTWPVGFLYGGNTTGHTFAVIDGVARDRDKGRRCDRYMIRDIWVPT